MSDEIGEMPDVLFDESLSFRARAVHMYQLAVGRAMAPYELSDVAREGLAAVAAAQRELAAAGYYRTATGRAADGKYAGSTEIAATAIPEWRRPPVPAGTTWAGIWPIDCRYEETPPPDCPVVYVFYDAANRACYVGQTRRFSGRMAAHRASDKPIAHWTAEACASREDALRRESELIVSMRPYLNVQGVSR